MSKIVSILAHDHSDFLKHLNSLERQTKIVAQGGTPDLMAIRAILDCFNGSPRRNHYRREEMLWGLLEERAPQLAAKVNVVLRYHRTLDARLQQLTECFAELESGQETGRRPFVEAATRFVEFERSHFADETEHLFPIARKILGEADVAGLDATLPIPSSSGTVIELGAA